MSAPIPYTCPMIDEVIEGIEAIDSVRDKLNDIDLSALIREMENIRKANEALRTWGEEQEERAEDAEEHISELNAQIEALKRELEEKEGIINYLGESRHA